MSNSKIVLSVICSFAIGGFVGHIITKKLLKEEYEEEINEEVNSVKEYYYNKYKKNEEGEKTYLNKSFSKPDLHSFVSKEEEYEEYEEYEDDEKYFETDEEEAQDKMDEELSLTNQEELNESMQTNKNKEPYLIDYSEFIKESDVYDKVDLYYYRADDILCDNKDNIMHSPEELFGLETWLTGMEKNTTIFIRDEKLCIDYEVHSLGLAFSDDVTSRLETDKERKYRRLARQKKAMDDVASEHIEDRDEDGEYVIKRPAKAKTKNPSNRRNNYYDYSKIKSIEDAEELDEDEE